MAQAKSAWVDFREIKARVSIVQILEHYGILETLSKSGNGDRLSGACPIHGGTNKTHFRVSISKNCWNCFGKCKDGGNIIDYVSKKEGVSFRDAALLIQKWFLDDAGEMPEPSQKPRFDMSKMDEKPRSRMTAAHRDIWSKVYEHPRLARVLQHVEAKPDSISSDEEMFVTFLILHLAASYRARKFGMILQEEGLRLDMQEFFALWPPALY